MQDVGMHEIKYAMHVRKYLLRNVKLGLWGLCGGYMWAGAGLALWGWAGAVWGWAGGNVKALASGARAIFNCRVLQVLFLLWGLCGGKYYTNNNCASNGKPSNK